MGLQVHPPGDSHRVGQSCHGGALALKNCVVASSGAFDNENDTGTVGPASDVFVVVGVIVVVVVVDVVDVVVSVVVVGAGSEHTAIH